MCNGTVGISTFLFFLIFNEYTAIWYLTCIFVVECPSPKNCDSTLPLCDPWLTLISYAWPLTDLCFLCVTPTWMFDPLSLHECISMTPSIICDATDLGPLCITLDWLFVTPSPPPSTSASYVWPPSYMYMWPLTNLGLLFMSFLGLDPDLKLPPFLCLGHLLLYGSLPLLEQLILPCSHLLNLTGTCQH